MHSARTGADKRESRRFHGCYHRFVFSHEAVACKDSVVVIISGNIDDLLDALLAFRLVSATVIRHTMNTVGVSQRAQLGCDGIPIDDRILLRQ